MRGVEHVPWLYDALMSVFELTGLRRWRAWLVGGVVGRVLEVGCGTGWNLPLYPPAMPPVGLDPDLAALLRARRRAPAAHLVRASSEALPFRSAVFDTVVSSLVFCSIDDPPRALSEVRRVLAADGTLRMLEHVRARTRIGGRIQDALQPAWTWASGGCRPNRPTEQLVEQAGFVIDPGDRRARRLLRRFVARLPAAGDRSHSGMAS